MVSVLIVRERRTIIALLSVLTAALLGACAEGVGGSQPAADSGGSAYVFENAAIVENTKGADSDSVTVSWDVRWQDAEFPGVRQCTWRLFDASGAALEPHSDHFVSMTPEVHGMSMNIQAQGSPATVAIECDERLDTGDPYAYVFTNIEPVPPSGEDETWAVRYDAVWEGGAVSGPTTCVAKLLGPSGGEVAAQSVNIFASDGSVHGSHVIMGPGAAGLTPVQVASASIDDCSPFGAS